MMDFLEDVWYYIKVVLSGMLWVIGLLLLIASVTAIGSIPLLFGLQWLAYITFPVMYLVGLASCLAVMERFI